MIRSLGIWGRQSVGEGWGGCWRSPSKPPILPILTGGFVIFGDIFPNLFAVVLGILGMYQKDRSKVLTIIGLGISIVTVAGGALLFLVSLRNG